MKLSQLSLADYNKLDSIPVINQDLSASGFTPVANTYYRHTGATTDTFTQGVIYLYDTAYHKLGESGGGTTLNRYEYSGRNTAIVRKIMNDSQLSYIQISISNTPCSCLVAKGQYNRANGTIADTDAIISVTFTATSNGLRMRKNTLQNTNGTLSFSSTEDDISGSYLYVVYLNYTEITA